MKIKMEWNFLASARPLQNLSRALAARLEISQRPTAKRNCDYGFLRKAWRSLAAAMCSESANQKLALSLSCSGAGA